MLRNPVFGLVLNVHHANMARTSFTSVRNDADLTRDVTLLAAHHVCPAWVTVSVRYAT
jgi:hypothetical protein